MTWKINLLQKLWAAKPGTMQRINITCICEPRVVACPRLGGFLLHDLLDDFRAVLKQSNAQQAPPVSAHSIAHDVLS
jgi:hypothetical protein